MMKKNNSRTALAQRANVIFIDLFLIILFMYILNSHFEVPIFKEIHLTKSSKEVAAINKQHKDIANLKCDSSGNLLLNGKPITKGSLLNEIDKIQAKTLLVGIDKTTSWEKVGPIIDILSERKLKIRFAYEQSK
jgi:biopolymer transport protein ExbD